MKKVLSHLEANKKYTKIHFKKMIKIEGDYEISNLGQVVSNNGIRKVLSSYMHGNRLRITINGKKYYIEDLVKEYH